MKPKLRRGMWGNIEDLFTERNKLSGRVDNTNTDLSQTKQTVSNNQAETDELMLDHEERIILLEVGE